MPEDRFIPHSGAWTPERIQRFWDSNARGAGSQKDYFSYHAGASIVAFVERSTRLRGRSVLDYGCGPGHLIAHLLARGARARGVEFSAASVQVVRERFAREPLFRGATEAMAGPRPAEGSQEDVVLLVEVVEHLDDATLTATLDDVHRLLVPKGRLIVTTPNDEDLSANMFTCPECGASFHRWQHVRSFTADSLSALLTRHGFARLVCEATLFGSLPLRSRIRARLRQALRRPGARPHLVYIGEASADGPARRVR